jgi:hypothetical protein
MHYAPLLVNWGAWPNANQASMTTDADTQYQSALSDKSYMMGVSPYFYTRKDLQKPIPYSHVNYNVS